jgi:hypothetical protein
MRDRTGCRSGQVGSDPHIGKRENESPAAINQRAAVIIEVGVDRPRLGLLFLASAERIQATRVVRMQHFQKHPTSEHSRYLMLFITNGGGL